MTAIVKICYEAISAWHHTEDDLKDAPLLSRVLDTLDEQLNKLTGNEYAKVVNLLQQEDSDFGSHKYWSEIQDVWWETKGLREGKYHENDSPRYEGRRGIPRIETVGKRLVDAVMVLIWAMDNNGEMSDEEDEAI